MGPSFISLIRLVLVVLAPVFAPSPAASQMLVDSANGLRLAIERADTDREIIVASGHYDITDLEIETSLTLTGRGKVVFFSSAPVAKGILNSRPGASLSVTNVTFEGATSPDKNGAGIRHDGDNLTLVNCEFRHNENGVLATGTEDGTIIISDTRFIGNGHGDGYSHGIYVTAARAISITNSQFIGTRIGHHVKSLAMETTILSSTFDDAGGRTSYAVDASKGGRVAITKSHFTQRENADNPALINYDLTRGGQAQSLSLTQNTIINHHPRGIFLRNKSPVLPVIAGNIIENRGTGKMSEPNQSRKSTGEGLSSAQSYVERTPPRRRNLSGVLYLPEFVPMHDALVAFKLRNNWNEASAPDFLTFGQAFTPGALAPDEKLSVRFGDKVFPVQTDVKSLHDDGSVRHGVITIATPLIKPGKTIDGALIKSVPLATPEGGTASAAQRMATPSALANMILTITLHDAAGGATTKTYDLAAQLERAAGQTLWLDGPLVYEQRTSFEVVPHLAVTIDHRAYKDGDARTSIIFSNEKSFSSGSRDLIYDVTIDSRSAGAAPIFEVKNLKHHRSSNWRKIIWTGHQPRLHIVHDTTYLIKTTAIPAFDTSFGIIADHIAENDETLRALPPLSPALVQQYMPSSGGRADIGPVPQWTANYLATQTEAAKRVMLANATAAGAVPWHYRDDTTGMAISIETYPKFWADPRGLEDRYAPDRPHPDLFASSDGGWTPDHSHKPALSAVPYLITGDRYFADELAMQAAFAIFGRWPALREGGLKAIDIEQVRASAWSLRDLSDAAFLLPDDHVSKPYLTRALEANLKALRTKYVDQRARQTAGELEGYFDEFVRGDPQRISPWQNDYFVLSLATAARRGQQDARDVMAWTIPFQTGRVLAETFDSAFATPYRLPINNPDGAPLSRWSQVSRRMREQNLTLSTEMRGYPGLGYGYLVSGYSALASLASATPRASTLEAFGSLARQRREEDAWAPYAAAGIRRHNQFTLTVTGPHDTLLGRNALNFSADGSRGSDILIGDSSDTSYRAKDGHDIIIALSGNDVIDGGAGDDWLVGGDGNDRLTGGPGRDHFYFGAQHRGHDIITDFDVENDEISIEKTNSMISWNASNYVTDTNDGARLTISDTASILFADVNAQELRLEQINLQ